MVAPTVKNEHDWIVGHVKDLKAVSELISWKQPHHLDVILKTDMTDDDEANLMNVLAATGDKFQGGLDLDLKYSYDNFKELKLGLGEKMRSTW